MLTTFIIVSILYTVQLKKHSFHFFHLPVNVNHLQFCREIFHAKVFTRLLISNITWLRFENILTTWIQNNFYIGFQFWSTEKQARWKMTTSSLGNFEHPTDLKIARKWKKPGTQVENTFARQLACSTYCHIWGAYCHIWGWEMVCRP